MSKRNAVGPQGDKDSLFDFSMASTPDDKPQRATAAQLASRRIKEVRRRRPNTPASGSAGAPVSSPFNAIDPNTVSSTTAGSQPTNGFSFGQSQGQSQSFPGANSAPSQQTPNGATPFSFGGDSGSSSFNFTSFNSNSSAPSNPFATMNPGTPNPPSDTNGFSGFKGNMFNLPSNQTPAQQPMPSFGANNTTGSVFGNATPATASSAPTTTGGMFGQTTASTAAPSTNIFGQASGAKASPFGQSGAFGSDSMQTSPDAKGAAAAAKNSVFGNGTASQPTFGASPSAPSPAGTSVFGGAGQTPSKQLFGGKPAETTTPVSSSIFGATTQPPASSTPAPAASTSTLFGVPATSQPSTPAQNPFQAASVFAPTPSSKPQEQEEKKPSDSSTPKPAFQFSTTPSAPPGGSSLFSTSASAAPASTPAFNSSFGGKPAFGASPAPTTGNPFAPQPTTTTDQEPSKTPEEKSNPFGSLFLPKPAAPSQEKPKSTPASGPFSNLSAQKPSTPAVEAKKPEPAKPATAAPMFPAPTPSAGVTAAPSLFAPPQPTVASAAAEPKTNAPASTIAAPPKSSSKATPGEMIPWLEGQTDLSGRFAANCESPEKFAASMKTPALPNEWSEEQKSEVAFLYRLRTLNEGFKKEVSNYDPRSDNFYPLVLFYLRAHDALGASNRFAATRKKRAAETTDADNEGPAHKKAKPSETAHVEVPSKKPNTSALNAAPSFNPSTSPNALEANQAIQANGAQAHTDEENSTASIFAQSFSKASQSGNEPSITEPSNSFSPFRPSTPGSTKANSFTTTPTTSPSKSLFSTPATANAISPAPPVFGQGSASNPAQSPFTVKPTETKKTDSKSAPAFQIPSFGASSGTTNFLSQFKSSSDKHAEDEKKKRKQEDFDSDEDDEAEWERQDAEKQRKKREEADARATKRAKFVPGKGFVFDEGSSEASEPKNTEKASLSNGPSSFGTGASVFDAGSKAPTTSSNIFGHLSATPSEVGENDEGDTEEESEGSPEEDTTDAVTSEVDSKPVSVSASANDSSDDGDFSKALKKSTPAATSSSEDSITGTATPVPGTPSGGRSLFDRVQYDQEGNPKRDGEAASPNKNPFGNLFSTNSKFSSSFNAPESTTPNVFGSQSKSSPELGSTPPSNVFGASTNTGGLFATPAPATSGPTSGSIFGTAQSAVKSSGDHTWKINSPIKFAVDSASPSKPDSGAATPTSESSKPFSTLFGAPAGSKPSDSDSTKPLGFSFGNPAQPSSSFLAPSTLTSATPSRSTTPGITSDTGAEESGDGDGGDSLPQVDLSRGAGEEDEDVVLEIRARGLKNANGSGWESQAVGFVRILKNRTTSRARVLLRASPSGKVVLNASLMKAIKYTASGNSVQFLVPQAEGPPEMWAIRSKEAQRLADAMEESKV